MTEFIGCPWCMLRVQGCRCGAPCGAKHCDRAFEPMPASTKQNASDGVTSCSNPAYQPR